MGNRIENRLAMLEQTLVAEARSGLRMEEWQAVGKCLGDDCVAADLVRMALVVRATSDSAGLIRDLTAEGKDLRASDREVARIVKRLKIAPLLRAGRNDEAVARLNAELSARTTQNIAERFEPDFAARVLAALRKAN